MWALLLLAACDGKAPVDDTAPPVETADSGDSGGDEDADGDGFPADEDCNDHNILIYPGAKERLCNTVDDNCDGNGAGSSAAAVGETEYADMAGAVAALGDGDTLHVCPGTWDWPGYDVGAGTVTVRSAYDDPTGTVLDAGGGARLFEVAGGHLVLKFLTLRGGAAGEGDGGAISVRGGELEVDTVWVEDSAAGRGGGLYAEDASVRWEGGGLRGNHAGAQGGGAWVVGGTAMLDGLRVEENEAALDGGGLGFEAVTATLTDVDLTTNSAAERGGGLYLDAAAAVVDTTVSGGSWSGNHAAKGGAVWQHAADLGLDGLDVYGNAATSGAVAYVETEGQRDIALVLTGGSYANHSAADGGVVYVDGRAGGVTVVFDGVSCTGNSATGSGGVLFLDGEGADSLTVMGGTFSSNGAVGTGGAFSLGLDDAGRLTLDGARLEGNHADTGGAVYVDLAEASAAATVTNTVFAGNRATTGGGAVQAMGGTRWDSAFNPLSVSGGAFTTNQAGLGGGGVSLYGAVLLQSSGVDWGTAGSDNVPDDIYTQAGPVSGAGSGSFECRGTTGC